MVGELRPKDLLVPLALGLLVSIIYIYYPIKYVVFALLGLIGTGLVLYDTVIGLMAGVFILPFLPDLLGLLYMFFLSFVYLYKSIFREHKKLRGSFIELPIWIYGFVIVFSSISSLNFMGSLRDLALHLGGLSFLFVMVNTIESKEDLNKVLTSLVFAASLVSLYGLYQYVVGVELDAAWVDVENNPDIKTRVYSVFYNPNILAEYLIMVTPISVGLFWHTKRLDKKFIFMGTTALMLLTIVLTLSRGGWLGIAFAALIFIVLVEKRLLLSIIPLSLGAIYLLPQTILNRILSIGNLSDSSNSYRLKLWEITTRVIRDHLIAGVGFGHLPFKETFETYIRTMPTYHAHNTFLQITAEIGLAGLVVFLIFIFHIFKYGIVILNRSRDSYIKLVGAGLISALGGLMLHGLVENVLYIPRIIISFWMIISFVLVLIKLEDKKQLEELDD